MRLFGRGKDQDGEGTPSGSDTPSDDQGRQPSALWGAVTDAGKKAAGSVGSAALDLARDRIQGPAWQPGQVVRQRDGNIEVHAESPAEAKLAIKEIRLLKREWQAKKKEASLVKSEENARWRERQAGRISTVGLGRGLGGKIVRGAIQGGRRGERMEHADRINQLSAIQADIDRKILQLDGIIAQLEAYIARSS